MAFQSLGVAESLRCHQFLGLFTGEGPAAPKPVGAVAGLLDRLERHNSVTAGTQHGPASWSTLWALPAPPGGKPIGLPTLLELPDMSEEEIDVQEACDAGFVDREDLVDMQSKHLLADFARILQVACLL